MNSVANNSPQCDEGHPKCNNCIKADKECVYEGPPIPRNRGPRKVSVNATKANSQQAQAVDYSVTDDAWLQNLIAASQGAD